MFVENVYLFVYLKSIFLIAIYVKMFNGDNIYNLNFEEIFKK